MLLKNKTVSKANLLFVILIFSLFSCFSCRKKGQPAPGTGEQSSGTAVKNVKQNNTGSKTTSPDSDMVPIEIKLPNAMFEGTPQNVKVLNLEPPRASGKDRPPFLAPKGTENIALNKPIIGFDEEPIIGELEMITDGDKEATDGSFVELGPGLKAVTIDLGAEYNIYALCIWHYHKQPRVYYDVIVQTAEDQDFITGVNTIFNNDIDNSSGLGVGKDMNYTETNEGKLIDAKGVKARFVRLYSNGNTSNELNNYIEVAVYGKPVK
jgi:hypothetical protein